MKKSIPKNQLANLIREASEVFRLAAKRTKILAALAWEPSVAVDFFKSSGEKTPVPNYKIDRKGLEEAISALKAQADNFKGEHPVLHWLTRTNDSYILGCRLLLELEKKTFYEISSELYGNSSTKPFEGHTTNSELAQAVASRLSVPRLMDLGESSVLKSAEEVASALESRLKERLPTLSIRVEVTDQIVSKVAAGMNRVRFRKGARFSENDLETIWNHEIESHCLTAFNGLNNETCGFLSSGGPRSTLTQEGIAVFYEVYGHSMTQERFITLCHRIEAIRKVEEGANFIELYRWFKERCESEQEAFFNAQRIFRGAPLSGGSPFTKDIVYLSGLLGVFNFLRIAVKNQNRLLVETLVCGRIALEDVGTLAWLRTHGLLNPPRVTPKWLANWEALLSFFSFSAFLGTVDLTTYQNYFQNHHSLKEWDFSL